MTLLCVAGAYFQLGSNFLSAVQVLVNAGAVAILFVFVMMLINLDEVKPESEKSKTKMIIGTFSVLITLGVLTLIINTNLDTFSFDRLDDNSMNLLFAKLFDSYYLPFELATMLLLGAIVAVVVLTGHYKNKTEEA
jgi:NADH-quinone oxidoreductase subunit J